MDFYITNCGLHIELVEDNIGRLSDEIKNADQEQLERGTAILGSPGLEKFAIFQLYAIGEFSFDDVRLALRMLNIQRKVSSRCAKNRMKKWS